MNSFLAENKNIKAVGVPADITAGLTGARIALSGQHRVAIVVSMGDSTGATVTATLKQHTAASGGTSKDLSIDNPYYKKAGAETAFTKVTPEAAAAEYALSADFASQKGIVVFEVLPENLDVNNGFGYVSIDFAAATVAKIVGAVYVCESKNKPAYSEDI